MKRVETISPDPFRLSRDAFPHAEIFWKPNKTLPFFLKLWEHCAFICDIEVLKNRLLGTLGSYLLAPEETEKGKQYFLSRLEASPEVRFRVALTKAARSQHGPDSAKQKQA
jgi:hypothetical protein